MRYNLNYLIMFIPVPVNSFAEINLFTPSSVHVVLKVLYQRYSVTTPFYQTVSAVSLVLLLPTVRSYFGICKLYSEAIWKAVW